MDAHCDYHQKYTDRCSACAYADVVYLRRQLADTVKQRDAAVAQALQLETAIDYELRFKEGRAIVLWNPGETWNRLNAVSNMFKNWKKEFMYE